MVEPISTGSCICKSVIFNTFSKPSQTVLCYCLDCRKGSGNLGQIFSLYNIEDVQVIDNNSKIKEYNITNTESGHPKLKKFCGECGCTILTLPMAYKGQTAVVRTTLLDTDFSELLPINEIIFKDCEKSYTKNKTVFDPAIHE